MERSAKSKVFLAALVALCMALALNLAACSPSGEGDTAGDGAQTESSTPAPGSGSGDIPLDDKVAAKTVIKGASNVFATTESITLTDEDSPATVSMGDAQFDQFFSELKAYKDVADVDLSECTFQVKIYEVVVETAREDSTQHTYQYFVDSADMVVNGAHITWDKKAGFQEV